MVSDPMDTLDRCFEVGQEVVPQLYGSFDNPPEEYKLKDGLLDQNMAGYTESRIPIRENGPLTVISSTAIPEKIRIDSELAAGAPKAACSTLLHEFVEYRATEELNSNAVYEGRTDYIAEFVEQHVCVEANEAAGEEICDATWNNHYDTLPEKVDEVETA